MSDKKIVVPQGMRKAVINAGVFATTDEQLEAALCWLSENPIVPTMAQYDAIGDEMTRAGYQFTPWNFAIAWQRRMFLAPEPMVPEAVKDLLCPDLGRETFTGEVYQASHWLSTNDAEVNRRILEAFRRGQASTSRKCGSRVYRGTSGECACELQLGHKGAHKQCNFEWVNLPDVGKATNA